MGGKGNPLGIMQKIEVVVHAQSGIRPEECDAQTSLEFWDTNGSPDLGQMTRPNQQKKDNLPNCGLCCPGWPQSKNERKRKER